MEENLLQKRAKIIEYKNQISKICSEYVFLLKEKTWNDFDYGYLIILYENLNEILIQMKDEGLLMRLSPMYIKSVKSFLCSLRTKTLCSTGISDMVQI